MSDGTCIIYKDGVFCVGFKRRVTPNNMVHGAGHAIGQSDGDFHVLVRYL